MFNTKLLLISILLCFSLATSANSNLFEKIYIDYKGGNYQDALDKLTKINGNKTTLGLKAYWKGLCLSKLQSYDKAIIEFEKAIKYNNRSDDLYYEYGQALYAGNELVKAREAFKKSAKLGFKKVNSAYYMGYISQILEQLKLARKFYSQIIRTKSSDESLRQISYFQLADVILSKSEGSKKQKKYIKKYVLKFLQRSVDIDPDSAVGQDALRRKQEIMAKYGLDPYLLKNGKRIPKKGTKFSFSQDMDYDSNVTLTSDVPTTTATKKDSYIFTSELYSKFRIISAKRLLINPELTLGHILHSDRSSTEVYSNDEYSIKPAIKNSLEHTYKGRPASLLFDFSYNYTARANRSTETKSKFFNNRSWTISFGEKLNFFDFGPTTLKIKYKDYQNYIETSDNTTTSFSASQLAILPNATLLIFFTQADFISSVTESNSTNSYLFRVDWIYPDFMGKFSLNPNFSITFLDTKEQSSTRGTEKTISPGFKLSKNVSQNLTFDVSYNYTINTSLSESNEYKKHVMGISLQYDL